MSQLRQKSRGLVRHLSIPNSCWYRTVFQPCVADRKLQKLQKQTEHVARHWSYKIPERWHENWTSAEICQISIVQKEDQSAQGECQNNFFFNLFNRLQPHKQDFFLLTQGVSIFLSLYCFLLSGCFFNFFFLIAAVRIITLRYHCVIRLLCFK